MGVTGLADGEGGGGHPLGHSLAVAGDRGAQGAQAVGVRVAGGGDDPGAPQPGNLDGGEADRGSGAVDQDRLPGLDAEAFQAPVGGLDRHRQGGRLDGVEARGDAGPVIHDRAVGGTRDRGAGVVGGAEDEIAGSDVAHALAGRLDGSGQLEADAAGQRSREQAAAQGPVGRVQAARVHGDADTAGTGIRHGCLVQPQDIGWLAVLVEADGPHGGGLENAHGISLMMTSEAVIIELSK